MMPYDHRRTAGSAESAGGFLAAELQGAEPCMPRLWTAEAWMPGLWTAEAWMPGLWTAEAWMSGPGTAESWRAMPEMVSSAVCAGVVQKSGGINMKKCFMVFVAIVLLWLFAPAPGSYRRKGGERDGIPEN